MDSGKSFNDLLDNFYNASSFKDTAFKEWVDGLNDTQKSALTAGDALAQYKGHLEAVSKSTSTFSKVTSKVKSTLKDIGGAIGSFALNGLVGALAGELTSLLIQLPTIDNTIQETLNTTASNAGSTVSNAANEVSQYKEQISGYLDVINSQSSSIEEVTSARQGLLSVQDELINKFGSEASAVQIVTDAINGQVDALDELTQKEYFKQKDIFNEKDAWTNTREFLESGFTQIRNWFNDLLGNGIDEEYNPLSNMENMVNQMNSSYVDISKTGSDAVDELLKKLYDLQDANGKLRISGNQMDILDTLENISSITSKYDGLSQNFSSDLSKATSSISSFVNANKELYNQYLLYEKILPNEDYANLYKNLSDAKTEYDNALTSGDESKIQSATQAYTDYFNQIQNTIGALDSDVGYYLENMFPDMESIVGKWNFERDFQNNTDNIKNDLNSIAEALANVTSNELEDFNKALHTDIENDAYDRLIDLSKKYGLSISDLTTQMQEFGLIQSDQYKALVRQFGAENISKLTDDDLKIAYKIENIGDMSFEELWKKINETRKISENEYDITSTAKWDVHKAALETENASDKYAQAVAEMKQAKEDWDAGLIGTDDFKSFAEWLSPNGMDDAANFIENWNRTSKYFTEGSDGLQAFLNQMEKLGHATSKINSSGIKEWQLDLENIPKIANDMNLSTEAFMTILNALGDYGFSTNYFGTMEEGVDKLTSKYAELGQALQKEKEIEEGYKAGTASKTALDEQRQKVKDIKNDILELQDGIYDLVNADTLEAQFDAGADAMDQMMKEYNNWLKEADKNSPAFDFINQGFRDALQQLSNEFGIQIEFDETGAVHLVETVESLHLKAEEAKQSLNDLRDSDGKINLDDSEVKAAYDNFVELRTKELEASNPIKLNIDSSSVQPEIMNVIAGLQDRINKIKINQEVGIDTTKAEEDLQSYFDKNKEVLVNLGITDGSYESIEKKLSNETIKIPVEYSTTDINTDFHGGNGTAQIDVVIKNKDDITMLKQEMDSVDENVQASVTCTVSGKEQVDEVKEFLASRPNTTAEIYMEPVATPGFESKAMQLAQSMTPVAQIQVDAKGNVYYDNVGQDPPSDESANVTYDKGDQEAPEDKTALVNYKLGDQALPLAKTATVNYTLGTQASPSEKTVKVHYVDGNGSVNGTAHANGSTLLSSAMTGTWRDYTRHKPNGAYVGGDWGIPYNQTALVGELQPELLVRNGKWQLIGANGAEFVGLRKGDIIFNHKQTEQLFKNGYVTGRGQPIGFTSHVQGTANAYYGGSSGSFGGGLSSGGSSSSSSSSSSSKPKYQSSNYKSTPVQKTVKKVEEAADDFAETMDYVAIAIQRATDEIEIHQSIANDLYQTFRNQNPELDKAISQSNEQLKLLQRAYDKYILQANASGLADSYKTKIQNGALDISEITDENLYNQIEEYQKWYDEAQNIRKEIIDLGASLRDLNVQKLENIADDFERVISYKDALYDTMDALNSLNELKGVETSVESLREMMGIQTDIAGYYQGQAEELQKQFDKLKGTAIDINNDDYWDWVTKIQECASNAYEAEQAVYELKEQIFDIQFTKPLEDTISQLELMQSEIETLSDLIDDNTLFSDNGSLENAGLAKLALLGKQLGNSKQQAAEYAEALKTLKKNLDNGNITQDKYNELLADYSSSQQQAVSDTKAAMDAIIELNTDGIQKAVDAYADLIDIRIKDKQAMKDYKDQQDDLMDKQSEINSVDAQIAAIRGDESQSQRLKQLLEQRSQLQKEYDDMVQENKYNAEIQGYEDAKELAQQNADEEIALIQSSLEKQNAVIEESLQLAQENYDEVFTYLGSIADVYGLSLQTNIVDSWKDAESAVNAYIEATSKAQAQAGTSSDKIDVPASKPTTTTPSKESSVDKVVNTNPVKQPNKTPSSSGSSGDSSIWKGIKVNTAWKHKSGLNQNVSIYDRIAWNGYQPGWSSQKQLFQNLGGSGTYKGTASQNSWMVQQLKSRGFSQGGIGNIIEKSGEDGVAIVRKGEGFVAPEHVSAIKDLLNTIPKLTEITKTSIPATAINSVRPVNVQLQYDSLVNVEGNLAKDAVPSLEKITDMAVNKMVRELKNISFTPGFRGLGR